MNIVLFATFLAVAHGAALDRFSVHESLSMWPDNNYMRIENSTPEECAEKCLAGTFPGCKSFRYKPEHKKCDLLVVAPGGDNVLTASTQGWDFYIMQTEQPTALARFSVHESLSMWPDNNYQRIENSTPEECAEKCLAGTFPGCKSFRYKPEHKKCDLLMVAPDGDNVLTASTQGWDFYTIQIERKALARFSVHESLSMWPDNNYERIENSTPEECAEKCLAGTFPGCKSFRYKPEHKKCDLLVVAPDGDNVLTASTQGWDFYTIQIERKALARFSVHESLSMWPDNNYERIENSTPEECAEKCLAGTFPGCKSFRYKPEHQKCDLLVVAPDGDNVLTASTQGWDFYTMQVERKALGQFLVHESLSMWPDNNYQRIENSTPEECAEKCLAGTFPGCKSFRYKPEHQKCDLLVVAPDGDNVLTASTQGWDFYTMQTEQPTVLEPKEKTSYTVCESGTISSEYCYRGADTMAECFNKPKIAVFKNPFLEAPVVSWGITHADLSQYYNTRVDISQAGLDETQLTLQFTCWSDSHCYKVGVRWMACGLVSGE